MEAALASSCTAFLSAIVAAYFLNFFDGTMDARSLPRFVVEVLFLFSPETMFEGVDSPSDSDPNVKSSTLLLVLAVPEGFFGPLSSSSFPIGLDGVAAPGSKSFPSSFCVLGEKDHYFSVE